MHNAINNNTLLFAFFIFLAFICNHYIFSKAPSKKHKKPKINSIKILGRPYNINGNISKAVIKILRICLFTIDLINISFISIIEIYEIHKK